MPGCISSCFHERYRRSSKKHKYTLLSLSYRLTRDDKFLTHRFGLIIIDHTFFYLEVLNCYSPLIAIFLDDFIHLLFRSSNRSTNVLSTCHAPGYNLSVQLNHSIYIRNFAITNIYFRHVKSTPF